MSTLHNDLKIVKAAAQSIPPTTEIAGVLSLLSKGEPYDRLFFESMTDPAWLPILDACGFFSNLPSSKSSPEGQKYCPYHLPLFGLVKVAANAPHPVSSILSRLKLPENPVIADQVLSCIAAIKEPSCFAVLQPIFAQISRGQGGTSWVWIQDLLKNWLQVGANEDVLVILSSYLMSMASSTERSPAADEWMTKHVDEIALEPLSAKYPLEVITIVFNALVRYSERGTETSLVENFKNDFFYYLYEGDNYASSYGVEDFTKLSQYETFETILSFRLYQACRQVYELNEAERIGKVDRLLRSHRSSLFSRLRWQIYADYPDISFEMAKKDAIERISVVGRHEFVHYHEFARLLQTFGVKNGDSFLSPTLVENFVQNVIDGPTGHGTDALSKGIKDAFRAKQLWPISSLIRGPLAAKCQEIFGDRNITLHSYQPFRVGGFRTGVIKSTVPKEAENIGKYSDSELWHELNCWPTRPLITDPANWLQREDYGAFAKAFVDYLYANPVRFQIQSKWWTNLKRPEPLIELLRRATARIEAKNQKDWKASTSDDWGTWLGIAQQIVDCSEEKLCAYNSEKPESIHEGQDWYWPRRVVADFLIAVAQSDSPEVQTQIERAAHLVKRLINFADSGLENLTVDRPEDWYTTAINTVRGRALEGLLKLALRQKNAGGKIDGWIFDLISDRLKSEDESPAIFALLGANLRLTVFLFAELLKRNPHLIFPKDRPIQRDAAIVAHFCYDHPMTTIVEAFPDFVASALEVILALRSKRPEETKQMRHTRDFDLQVGIHICFYYWNKALAAAKAEELLERYFEAVTPATRAGLINQIASIFEQTQSGSENVENDAIFKRVMEFWEWRSGHIFENIDQDSSSRVIFERELSAFLNWVVCECFPFEWRFNHASKALHNLGKLPDMHRVLFTLQEWNKSHPERLKRTLELLFLILSKSGDSVRWQITVKRFGPLLSDGLRNAAPETREVAIKCRDLLLSVNLFDFLNLEEATPN